MGNRGGGDRPLYRGQDMGGLTRVHWHWTAGGGYPSDLDRQHYHYLIDHDGQVRSGRWPAEANIAPKQGAYAAHTLNANTGAIGIGVCGMAGATERPFSPGRAPMNELQIDALIELTARLCREHGIAVTRRTVLSHAEVQPTLGIKQRGKWDIAWVPGMMSVGDPVRVGDALRARVIEAMK